MAKAGPGPKPAFAKTWSKAYVSLRLTDTVRRELSQVALEFMRQDLCGVVDCWSGTPSSGSGIFFLGLGRVLGVGIAYVTSFEYFASFLFGVGSASKEIGRLAQGFAAVKSGTNMMHFIHAHDKPRGRKTTYLNIVANIRPQK